jgi:hypothetical protein
LFILGSLSGSFAAGLAVFPFLLARNGGVPWAFIGFVLITILASGLLWVYLATRAALKGSLISALQEE